MNQPRKRLTKEDLEARRQVTAQAVRRLFRSEDGQEFLRAIEEELHAAALFDENPIKMARNVGCIEMLRRWKDLAEQEGED